LICDSRIYVGEYNKRLVRELGFHMQDVIDIEEYHHGKTKSIYINRAFGCDCYHCASDGDFNAGAAEG
jgi:hypothetical protein